MSNLWDRALGPDHPLAEVSSASRRPFKLFVSFLPAIAVATISAALLTKTVAAANETRDETPSFESRFWEQHRVEQALQSSPQLKVNQEVLQARRNQDEVFPLGVTVAGSADEATVVVKGLATGSSLTVGAPLGTNSWRMAAADLHNALVRPPKGFVGQMDVVVELRLADATLLDYKSRRLLWTASGPKQLTGRPIRQLERREIDDLIRRGNEFIIGGDLASARLVLQRAAEAGDPKAALLLAGTYDPIALERVGIQAFARDIIQGFAPDVNLALTWYMRAKELGSAEAMRRLEILIGRDHRAAPEE
jgi:hypothetical protein